MNLIRATSKLLKNSSNLCAFRPSVRGSQYLDRNWMPGPYPKTESERLAAAKKYNLLPEEYEAYDPEKWEFAYGDYPKLPCLTFYDKDPYYAWDYLEFHSNYGEPVHVNTTIYGPTGYGRYKHLDFKFSEVVILYAIGIGAMVLYAYWVDWWCEDITIFKLQHRVFPGETYYHYPTSNLEAYH